MPNFSIGSGNWAAATAISRDAATAESCAASCRERSTARRCASCSERGCAWADKTTSASPTHDHSFQKPDILISEQY